MKIVILVVCLFSVYSSVASTVTFSKEIRNAHTTYNAKELLILKSDISKIVEENCNEQFAELNVEVIKRDGDLFVSRDTYVVKSANKSIFQIVVTLWQSPGGYLIDNVSKLSCN